MTLHGLALLITQLLLSNLPVTTAAFSTAGVVFECFTKVEENIFRLKTHYATCHVIHFYNAGVVTYDRVYLGLGLGFFYQAILKTPK
jgi:hypothetical protein